MQRIYQKIENKWNFDPIKDKYQDYSALNKSLFAVTGQNLNEFEGLHTGCKLYTQLTFLLKLLLEADRNRLQVQ